MLYAASILYEVLKVNKYKNIFTKIQRKLAIRICCAFRTVSTESLLVIAGVVPIDLQAGERSRTYKAERTVTILEKHCTLDFWQKRWMETSSVGTWTRRLIPDIRPWIN